MNTEIENNVESQDLTDNSETEKVEPSTEDNSDTSSGQEPENNSDDKTDKTDSNTFTDLETANKSYQELQKKLGEQGTELGDLRKQSEELKALKEKQNNFLQKLGYNSLEEYEDKQREIQYDEDVAKFEVNRYLDYIDHAEFPDEVRKLITNYPIASKEEKQAILDGIEANFPTETIKKVASEVALYRGQLDGQRRQALEEQQINVARSYLQDVTQKYSEDFKNEAFVKLYGEAFRALGLDLNTDYFMQLCQNLKKSWQDEALKAHNIQVENENTKDRISDSVSTRTTVDSKNILDMSEEEIRKELRKYK